MRVGIIISCLYLTAGSAFAQAAPPVTGLQAVRRDGQTFITWMDPATGADGSRYRFDLYRSTIAPITDITKASLVEEGIYNNSAQLIGPKPFNQTTRQNHGLRTSVIQNGHSPLSPWSGLAVYTNTETANAYYAVITRDVANASKPSPLTSSNSLSTAVSEQPAAIVPLLQVTGMDATRQPQCCAITGKKGLPLWLRLHGSGGSAPSLGDLWAYWGDSSMGYQDGIQSIFAVHEDHRGAAFAPGGLPKLIMAPQDAVWSIDGDWGSETYWYGYRALPHFAKDRKPHVYPFTQAKLALIVPWAVQHYAADPNRVYGISESMGAYGLIQWGLRHGDIFAALFMRVPILGSWPHIPSLVDTEPNGKPKPVIAKDETLPDGTPYGMATDITGWIAQDCSRTLPFIAWSSGRNDTGLAEHRMWSYAVTLADTLRGCHYGFSFIWGNGAHTNATASLANTLLEEYQTVFARNLSYPAFTNSSLDADYGNGDPSNGSLSGCINCGWKWTIIADMPTSWVTSVTNTQATEPATADITARNTQLFKPPKGATVNWSTSSGQEGTALVDSFGLATAKHIKIPPGADLTLTFAVQIPTVK